MSPHQMPGSVRLSGDASGSAWPDRAERPPCGAPPPSPFPLAIPSPNAHPRPPVAAAPPPPCQPQTRAASEGGFPVRGARASGEAGLGSGCTARRKRAVRCGPRAEDCGVLSPCPSRRARRAGPSCAPRVEEWTVPTGPARGGATAGVGGYQGEPGRGPWRLQLACANAGSDDQGPCTC